MKGITLFNGVITRHPDFSVYYVDQRRSLAIFDDATRRVLDSFEGKHITIVISEEHHAKKKEG